MRNLFAHTTFLFCLLGIFSCSDDNVEDKVIPVTGDAIDFTAIAEAKDSRIQWGDVSEDQSKVDLNWEDGDLLSINCLQSPQKSATYKVVGENTSRAQLNFAAEITGNDNPLHWGNLSEIHHFTSFYPSQSAFTEDEKTMGYIKMDGERLKGFLPMNQTNRNPKNSIKLIKENNGHLNIVVPDMRYALMVAKTNINPAESRSSIQLNYHTIVTSLEFDITANTIDEKVDKNGQIELIGASLCSSQRHDLCGEFSYDFKTDIFENANAVHGKHNQVTVEVPEKVLLKKGDVCRMTFFISPNIDLPAAAARKDMFLRITYSVNGHVQMKIASLNVDIKPRYKHYFRNMVMPPLTHQVGSNWMASLNPNALISQLSIPGAGSAFSNYSDVNANGVYYAKQQVKSYEELWNMGIRAFEFETTVDCNVKGSQLDGAKSSAEGNLGNCRFVCGENVLWPSETPGHDITLDQAFDYLAKFVVDHETYKHFAKECLILVMRYHAVTGDGTYNPQLYLDHLVNFLNSKTAGSTKYGNTVLKKEHFVMATPQTKYADLQGKIVIFVRPGDDAYMKHYAEDSRDKNALTSTSELAVRGGWENHISIIQNWGSAYDCWDVRYPGYAREATWAESKQPVIEDFVYGISDSPDVAPGVGDFGGLYETQFPDWKPVFDLGTVNFSHQILGNNASNVQIQEFARVVPRNLDQVPFRCTDPENNSHLYLDHTQYLWVKWRESMSQKENMIRKMLDLSTATANQESNSMFINVLSGYYVTKNWSNSAEPFKQKFPIHDRPAEPIVPTNQGNGGNFAALAADLNTFLYDELLKDTRPIGPLGLIQMDYIGASETDFNDYCNKENVTTSGRAATATHNLVNLIIMNNFKFSMREGTFEERYPQFDFTYSGKEVITD